MYLLTYLLYGSVHDPVISWQTLLFSSKFGQKLSAYTRVPVYTIDSEH